MTNYNPVTRIKVFGIGGGGNNAVNRMVQANLPGAEFYVANTDQQVLSASACTNRILLGSNTTRGLGAGGKPEVGKQAAEESIEEIKEHCKNADIVFIATGLGGGTGTGASPIFAKCAKELGALTIAIVTKPFEFEGKRRRMQATAGLDELRKYVDSLIIVPNEKVKDLLGDEPFDNAFEEADNVLRQACQTIIELVSYNAKINLDFADIRSTMQNKGIALIGVGQARKSDFQEEVTMAEVAVLAAERAINCPLLEAKIEGAKNAIINVAGGSSITINCSQAAVNYVVEAAGQDIDTIYGLAINERQDDIVIVTVIATGFEEEEQEYIVNPFEPRVETSQTNKIDNVEIPDFFANRN